MSDLHLDYLKDSKEWLKNLNDVDCDVIAVAGDLSNFKKLGDKVTELCERFSDKPIVYINGNHDFWGSRREDVVSLMKFKMGQHKNFDWVDIGESREYCGRTITGMTLWFRKPINPILEFDFLDFYQIKKLRNWVYEENSKAIEYLETHLSEDSIVMTHHLASYKSVAPMWVGDSMNAFFVCDLTSLIETKQPQLWVHGHSHEVCDYKIDKTRIICNPKGNTSEGRYFNPNLVIDV